MDQLLPSDQLQPLSFPRAATDQDLIKIWLYGKSQSTRYHYERDIATFLHWLSRPSDNVLSTVRLEDLQEYLEVLKS
jgi:site-specific recombinase XerD